MAKNNSLRVGNIYVLVIVNIEAENDWTLQDWIYLVESSLGATNTEL